MSTTTIIITITELSLDKIMDNDPYLIEVQLMQDGHKLTDNRTTCTASRVYSMIGTWLASVKHHLT